MSFILPIKIARKQAMQKSGQHQFTLPVPLVQDRNEISSRKGHFNCSGLLKRELNMCQVILGNALSFRSAQFPKTLFSCSF